ncbi:hypothetical protein ARMSODRAFT_1080621 [Armillaria solidipes]|uniref:Uncharacterized protein n=1 Tax=Armillaria solidipes TaxID=1076256 RepID=A0A2H3BVR9_9AGAR|nr:hypothetical protein ARMSODRAFT_1080621 [Armillaria solidipes]
MDQPVVFDLRSSSARQSKSLSSQPTHYPTVRPQKRSFLSVLNHIRRRVFSRLLSHPIPSRIPIPTPTVEPKVESEVMVISQPVKAQVRARHTVSRKVHYETVRRRQHREEPVLYTFQNSVARSRRFKRPSTAPQLQNYGSGKRFNGFIRRREKKQAWSGEWNRTDIRDVIKDLRSLR